ncbi:hypothetical protein, partial [Deinococcus sp. GbtcB9]|uniref:hypothetical protein n=1 Tax=Deinococcus sp. GbtcB9 TaxID=2824754 RepID=UPI001C2F92C3
LTDDKLNIILELFDIYNDVLKEVAFNAVIARVLKLKVQSSFRGLLEKSLKTETYTQMPNSTTTVVRKEMLPDWAGKEDNESSTVEGNKQAPEDLEESQILLDALLGKNKK